jgi:8-oxo-dGTP pyrophosphatase MutT (NUDIX family)
VKQLVEKVVIYCVQDGRLLVFRHLDYPADEVGLQVPAGSIRQGECRKDAAIRELEEETGRKGFVITGFIGTAFYDISPYRDEVQERFFFRASAPRMIEERWIGGENHDGNGTRTRFDFFWIPLSTGHVLQSGQGALLGQITNSTA